MYNKNFVLLQTADVILFNNFNKKEVRIKVNLLMVDLKEVLSKSVQNILSPEIINKEKIKTNTFNNNSSKEEMSDYENSVTRKLSVKDEKGQ